MAMRKMYLRGTATVKAATPDDATDQRPDLKKKDEAAADDEEKVEAEEEEVEAEEGGEPDEEKVEAEADDDAPVVRDFEMRAYTGGVANVAEGPHVFDLAGMAVGAGKTPILLRHDDRQISGWGVAENTGKELVVRGKVTTATAAGKEVIGLADAEFPWQASIGILVDDGGIEAIQAEEARDVNGRTFTGPLSVVGASVFQEASFVPFGADSETEAKVLGRPKMDPVKKERERAKALREAFPEDAAFALEHIEKGSTLVEAKAAYADVLAKRLSETGGETPTKFAAAEGSAPSAGSEDKWRSLWEKRYEALRAGGDDDYTARREATVYMLKRHAGETQAFIAAANGR